MEKNYNLINILGKRIISLVVCLLLLIGAISAITATSLEQESILEYNLNYTFLFTEPKFQMKTVGNSGYNDINLPGCISMGREAGQPKMPVKFIKLLLPPKTSVKNVKVVGTPIELELENIDLKESPIFPYQNPVPLGSEPEEFVFDNTFYSSETMYPGTKNEDYGIGYSHGYAILDIALNPVQYKPNEGKIFLYPELTVSINLEENDYVNQFFRNNPEDEAWVKSLVWNPEIAKRYTLDIPTFDYPGGLCDSEDNYDYVIITTEGGGLDYWETSEETPYNWESLMQKHEEDDGLSCRLVTIQDIYDCNDYDNSPPFNDYQAHIREFCKDAYLDWETSYILIGGDDEGLASIPARHMDTSYEGNIDSDIYWSNLDENFNDDEDSLWGEEGDDGFDLYTETFIGRITCDEPQDVSNWLTKSFYYADSGDLDYLENAAFYGGDTGWTCQGDDFMDFSAVKGTDDWLGPNPHSDGPWPSWLGFLYGFETWNKVDPDHSYTLSVMWTAEPPNPGWKGGSESAAIAGLKDAINNDNVAFISGIAHAHSQMSLDVGMNSWESQYTNTKPFFIHDYGCHCGDIDASDDGVLHSMLFHSDTELAFGCVYNTCYGWGNYYSTNSSSALQAKLFWDYFLDVENNSLDLSNWQFGKAQAWSKDVMAPTIDWDYSYGTWRAIIQGCLLFGDPAQKFKPLNLPPDKPQKPEGPIEGVTAIEYEYSSSTVEPEGEKIFYLFDWGDGTDSGWIGPYDSGQTGKASHIWDVEGYYDVTVKAKDELSMSSGFSDPLTVHILQAPRLYVRAIFGGLFKVNAKIRNTGSIDATNVGWTISLSGNVFMGKETTGTIPKIAGGEEETVESGFILGLGPTVVTVDSTISESYNVRKQDGTMYLFYVWVIPSGR